MSEDNTKKPTKTKKKPRGGNSPVIGMNGYNLEEGDNNKFVLMNLEVFNLPKINLKDPNAVSQRLGEFFNIYAKYDQKPTMAGMAMALGMSRTTLSAIVHDKPVGTGCYSALPREVTDLIKKAHDFMEVLWESYMLGGKIVPPNGIFIGKNQFGYVDQVDHVITPNVDKGEDYTANDIKDRYLDYKDSD